MLEVVGHARCIEVFTVVAGAVQLDVLGPAELVLQAEQQQAATAGVPPGTLGTGMPCAEVSVNGATSLRSAGRTAAKRPARGRSWRGGFVESYGWAS
ncbi:hypothetical protein [Pseudomonas jinjuensis]|uniref:hypothetical protein n=1 Tax=Pseudomonas jinjuensis TaxID=198616 RepID=UPI001C3FD648|nr:hypothetical protein [Pseudomonas jinjuensis]